MSDYASFVTDTSEFLRRWATLQRYFRLEHRLPSQVFQPSHVTVAFTEFERIASPEFAQVLDWLAAVCEEDSFSLAVVAPEPEAYFRRHFGYYGLAHFSGMRQSSALLDTLAFEPLNSPADALTYNGSLLALAADNGGWLIWAERELGVAVLGAKRGLSEKLRCNLPGVIQWFPRDQVLYDVISLSFESGEAPPDFEATFRTNYADAAVNSECVED
jgi:hypothetical protein